MKRILNFIAIVFLSIVYLTLFSYVADAFQTNEQIQGCGKECTDCHKITLEEAKNILKAEVKSIGMSPVKGLWEIRGIQEGNDFTAYLDFAKKYVVLARFIPISDIGKPASQRRIDPSQIPLEDALVIGSPNAPLKIIIFDDPDCPYCRELHKEAKKIIEKRKDIAFYIKLYPLQSHPKAYEKSKAILCKKSVKMLEDAFEGKELPKPGCEAKEIDENIKLAKTLGIDGTPFIILPDGRVIPGYVDADALLNILEAKQ
ncbi:MAG: DsbC family protein [Deltaproteobacteria bacterium]|nr:DsbC family protein [Deltaproteobacteria bacterium]